VWPAFRLPELEYPPVLRFHLPLIEPDVRISRTRLSEQALMLTPTAGGAVEHANRSDRVASAACILSPPHLVLAAQPPAEPTFGVFHHQLVDLDYRTQTEIVSPAIQHLVEFVTSSWVSRRDVRRSVHSLMARRSLRTLAKAGRGPR
jgi:hypothetical protein